MQKRLLGLALAALVGVAGACNTADLKQPGTSGGNAGGGNPDVPCEQDCDPALQDGGPDAVADPDAATIPTSSSVTIQIQPSDFGAAVETAIRGAKSSVHMTMYLLTDTTIIDALGDLKAAGKDVKVVLNRTFPPNGGDNTSAFTKLEERGVPVEYAPSAYTFTHAKSVIIDSEKVLIMTMNLTQTSARDNREFIATDSDPADVADCEKLFAADFGNKAVSVQGKLVVSPEEASPSSARARLKALMESAKTSLDVEIQSLSDDTLTDAIVAAHKAKVAVRVVIATGNFETPAQAESTAKMKAAGVPVVGLAAPYIHAKAVVVDNKRVFVGSHNFTPTALVQNREIGVVTDAPTEVTKVRDVIAKDFAAGAAL